LVDSKVDVKAGKLVEQTVGRWVVLRVVQKVAW
jgi:hypothetical protein